MYLYVLHYPKNHRLCQNMLSEPKSIISMSASIPTFHDLSSFLIGAIQNVNTICPWICQEGLVDHDQSVRINIIYHAQLWDVMACQLQLDVMARQLLL